MVLFLRGSHFEGGHFGKFEGGALINLDAPLKINTPPQKKNTMSVNRGGQLTLKWTVKNVPRKFALPSVNWLHLSLKVFFHARIETCMFLGKMFKVYIFWCHPHEKTLFFFFSFFHFFLVARTQRSQRRRQRKKKKLFFVVFFVSVVPDFYFFQIF